MNNDVEVSICVTCEEKEDGMLELETDCSIVIATTTNNLLATSTFEPPQIEAFIYFATTDGTQYLVEQPHPIGNGAFAKVFKATRCVTTESARRHHIDDEKVYALKKFSSSVLKSSRSLSQISSRTQFMNEKVALQLLSTPGFNHKNVVTLYDEGPQFLVLEMAQCDLFDHLMLNEKLCMGEATLIKFQHQLCSALDAVHAAGFAHLDIKPENILLKNGIDHILLADFGCARQVNENSLIVGIAGSLEYNAPEVSDDVPFEPFPCDIWSLACVYFICLTGAPPFDNAISCPFYLHVRDNNWDAFWSVHEGVSKHHQDRFMEMVTLPNYRPCAHHLATVMFLEEERSLQT